MIENDLTQREAHFAFGKNWAAYAEKVTAAEIAEAERGLTRLLGTDRLNGQRFLDIGCGSGLHALAALRLGAREVVAVDLDPDSVATARAMLERHAPSKTAFRVERSVCSICVLKQWGLSTPSIHGECFIIRGIWIGLCDVLRQ